MPTISDILESVSVPELIKDDFIRNGRFETTSHGLRYYSGGFTVVFPVNVNGEKWAFRCWHNELGNVRNRFNIVSNYLSSISSSYFSQFHYKDEGIIVAGRIYPTTRMKWIEGETINKYIENNAYDSSAIKALADSFLKMIEYLHEKKIAHGDLQHGNIIVHNGSIKLVDYDSIFVPGLEGNPDIIVGKADFQHPKRKEIRVVSEKLDYFSELVIYLSILSISKKPEILRDFSIDDSLLFHASDWNDFEKSRIFKVLNAIDDDEIRLLLLILSDYLKEDNINNLRPFTDVRTDMMKIPIIHSFRCGKASGIVYKDLETELKWKVENFTKIYIDGKEVDSGASSKKIKLSEDKEIVIRVQNGLNSVSQSINVKVVEPPVISFSVNKLRLRRNNGNVEPAYLSWKVNNAHAISVLEGDNILSNESSAKSFIVNPQIDTIYWIEVIGLDKITKFTKGVRVIIRDSSDVSFESDKLFSLPGVPITLTWDVKNAISVRLNDKEVSLKGKTVFTPEVDTEYVLSVVDEFETKTERVKVRMLPLPVIQSIMVNTPEINKSVKIIYKMPDFKFTPKLPVIKTKFAEIDIPEVVDLKKSGLFVELPVIKKPNFSSRISRFIKRILKPSIIK